MGKADIHPGQIESPSQKKTETTIYLESPSRWKLEYVENGWIETRDNLAERYITVLPFTQRYPFIVTSGNSFFSVIGLLLKFLLDL